jgi:hypothetical protein
MATIYIRDFPDDLQYRVKVQVAKERTTLRELVIRLLTQYVDQAESAEVEAKPTKAKRKKSE